MPLSPKHLIAVAALLLAAILAAAVPAAARDLHIGIDANTREWGTPGDEQDNVVETGAGWIREELYWDVVEATDDVWDWSWSDRWFRAAAERGLRILPVLDSPPCWAVARPTGGCTNDYPDSDAEFGEFVAAVVGRYGPGGSFWSANPTLDDDLAPRWYEIWNEPYYPLTTGGVVSPRRYARLFRAASAAGRAQNPAARFLYSSNVDVFDSTASRWVNWAATSVDEIPSLGDWIDGIAIHPYPTSKAPDEPPVNGSDSSFLNTDRIWSDWSGEGIRKPFWITEVGYSSCDDGADECVPGATQSDRELKKAEWLGEIFDMLGSDAYGYVHAVFLYRLRQWRPLESPTADKEGWWGILDGAWEPLPAWSVFADAVAEHDGLPVANSTIASQTLGSGTASFAFRANDPTATFECRLDSGSWTACTSPRSYSGLSAGNHTFRVRAVNALATETTPAISVWTN